MKKRPKIQSKKLLIATTNKEKFRRLKSLIEDFNLELISLSELDYEIAEPKEDGRDALENSLIKARQYWKGLKEKIPVLTQDDSLVFERIKSIDDPGGSIKRPVVKKYGEFNDENAITYYSELARKYGGTINFRFEYGHAYCDGRVLDARPSKLFGVLMSKPSKIRTPGYFLADLMKVNVGDRWRYYSELREEEKVFVDKPLANSIAFLLKKYLLANNVL